MGDFLGVKINLSRGVETAAKNACKSRTVRWGFDSNTYAQLRKFIAAKGEYPSIELPFPSGTRAKAFRTQFLKQLGKVETGLDTEFKKQLNIKLKGRNVIFSFKATEKAAPSVKLSRLPPVRGKKPMQVLAIALEYAAREVGTHKDPQGYKLWRKRLRNFVKLYGTYTKLMYRSLKLGQNINPDALAKSMEVLTVALQDKATADKFVAAFTKKIRESGKKLPHLDLAENINITRQFGKTHLVKIRYA